MPRQEAPIINGLQMVQPYPQLPQRTIRLRQQVLIMLPTMMVVVGKVPKSLSWLTIVQMVISSTSDSTCHSERKPLPGRVEGVPLQKPSPLPSLRLPILQRSVVAVGLVAQPNPLQYLSLRMIVMVMVSPM